MNFVYGLIMFLIGLIAVVAFLPAYNEIISLLPYSGIVVYMSGLMVLLLVVGLIYRLYYDSTTNYSEGGIVR